MQYLRNPFIDTNTNKSRLLQSNHPSKVRQYKDELISYIKKRKIISKTNEIKQKLNNKLFTHQDMIQIDKFDNTLAREKTQRILT